MMLDCEKCWNTPCHCGNEGYYVVYKSQIEGRIGKGRALTPSLPPSEEELKKLGELLFDVIRGELR